MKRNDIRVLKTLLEHKEDFLSIREIARLVKKDYKNVHEVIERLALLSLVTLTRFGKARSVVLQHTLYPILFEAEYERRKDFLKDKNLAIVTDSFRKMHSSFFILLLFGSYVKKKNTKQSDIDLLFVVPDDMQESFEKQIYHIARTVPLDLHIHIFSETDFLAMKDSRKITVGSEAIKHNIILHGIEAYYELIQ